MSKMIKLAILIGICVFSIYIICVDGLIYLFGGYDLLRYEYGALLHIFIDFNSYYVNYIYYKR